MTLKTEVARSPEQVVRSPRGGQKGMNMGKLVSMVVSPIDAKIMLMSVQKHEEPKKLILRLASCVKQPRVLDLAEADAWFLWHNLNLLLVVDRQTAIETWLRLTAAILALYPEYCPPPSKDIPLRSRYEDTDGDTSESPAEDDAYHVA